MPEEIMITVKQADGTIAQVPLSSISKKDNTADKAPKADEVIVDPIAVTSVVPEAKEERSNDEPAEVSHDLIPSPVRVPATTTPNVHVFDEASEAPKAHEAHKAKETSEVISAAQPKKELTNDTVTAEAQAVPVLEKPVETAETLAAMVRKSAATDAIWTPKDAHSPLEEPIAGAAASIVPNKIIVQIPDEVQEILTKHTLVLDVRLQKRLSGLIDTAVRHVRTPAQFVDALQKDIARGGMGFAPNVSESVLSVLHIVRAAVPKPQMAPTKTPHPAKEETKIPLSEPATSIPNAPKKVPMTDIKPPTIVSDSQTMNPVEELASMTLDDFRRLGGRGQLGIEDVKKKFEVLLKESIIVYMNGVKAWHRSPLFSMYIDIAAKSIRENRPIVTLLTGEDTFTQEEWSAITEIQNEIRL